MIAPRQRVVVLHCFVHGERNVVLTGNAKLERTLQVRGADGLLLFWRLREWRGGLPVFGRVNGLGISEN